MQSSDIKKCTWTDYEQKNIIANILRYHETKKLHPKTQEIALKYKYKMLNGFPVPEINKLIKKESIINEKLSEPSLEPDKLKTQNGKTILEWAEEITYEELEKLFNDHYITTDKHVVRYSKEFIKWALEGTDIVMVGIRSIKNNQLVGVICGRSTGVTTTTVLFNAMEIVFFVVHQQFRQKGLPIYLAREFYRKSKLLGYSCGIFSANSIVPKPYAQCQMYIRYINTKKLYEIEYFKLEEKQSIQEKMKALKITDSIKTPGFRKMTMDDLDLVHKLFCKQTTFSIYPEFTKEQFKKRFLDYPDIIKCYVVENEIKMIDEDLRISDFISFVVYEYVLLPPYNKYCEKIKIAMIYYTCFSTKYPITRIFQDIFYECKQMDIDAVVMYNIMEYELAIFETGWEPTGEMRWFNLVNWQIPNIKSNQIGFATIE